MPILQKLPGTGRSSMFLFIVNVSLECKRYIHFLTSECNKNQIYTVLKDNGSEILTLLETM